MSDLIVDDNVAKIIDELISRAKNTDYGLITNFGKPYGISFQELTLIGDKLKYGDKFVTEREKEKIRKRLTNKGAD